MALSIDTIYQPLNDFFVEKLSVPAGTRLQFRFDKLGSVITDADFIDENHPNLGYLPALAIEKFSDLVNRVPVDVGDGVNVLLSQDSIDDTYFFRLLSPAVPHLADTTDPIVRKALLDAFNAEKATAQQLWGKINMESLTGIPMQYKPTLATPEAWYDSGKDDGWTNTTFEISQPPPPQVLGPYPVGSPKGLPTVAMSTQMSMASTPEAGVFMASTPEVRDHRAGNQAAPPDKFQIWKLVPSAEVVGQVIEPASTQPVDPQQPLHRMPIALQNQLQRIRLGQPEEDTATSPDIAQLDPEQLLRATNAEQVRRLDIRDRLLLNEVVATVIPTAPTTTDKIAVTFDYCIVQARRKWLLDVFLNDSRWAVPGVPCGALSDPNTPGAISQLPIAMVAIRNLVITANWTPDDVAASSNAIAFGPFKIGSGIVNNSLTHKSIQTIGWLLEKLGALPPQTYSAAP